MADHEWGVIESVDIVGQAYQVQTELVDAGELRVRTTVFHEGRVVACRDARLHRRGAGRADVETARELMLLHHQNVLHGFARRTSEYMARRSRVEVGRTSARPTAPELEENQGLADSLPPTPEDPAVSDALDVRRLITELRDQLEAGTSTLEEGDAQAWLHVASDALREVIDHPRFTAVRLDEQVLFHQVRDRIDQVKTSSPDSEELSALFDDLHHLCGYAAGINRRSDLIAFDRHLLAWSVAVLRREGSTLSVRSALRWVRGRDRRLDALLPELASTPVEAVIAELERVLAAIT